MAAQFPLDSCNDKIKENRLPRWGDDYQQPCALRNHCSKACPPLRPPGVHLLLSAESMSEKAVHLHPSYGRAGADADCRAVPPAEGHECRKAGDTVQRTDGGGANTRSPRPLRAGAAEENGQKWVECHDAATDAAG